MTFLFRRLGFEPSRGDYYVIAGCASFVLLCSVLLYLDMNRSVEATGQQIGVIVYRMNDASRKFDQQVIWEGVEAEMPVYNNDSIRTGEASEAQIKLASGTLIDVDQNSLIVLSVTEESADIDFAYGSIAARQEEGAEGEGTGLNIRTDEQTISLAGDGGGSDLQLNRDEERGVDVVVNEGAATIQGSDGQAQTIQQDERASLSGGAIEVQRINLRPTAPQNNERYFVAGAGANVNFAWSSVEGNPPVTLQVARDRGFGARIINQVTRGTGTSARLPAGVFYWRITARNPQTGEAEFSEARKVTVVQNATVGLIAPANGSTTQYVQSAPLINFAWTPNEHATAYNLEISRDANFSNIVETRRARTRGTAIALEEGNYFWRVRTISNMEGASVQSPVFRFSITRREQIAPPQPVYPIADKQIAAAFFERAGVAFRWDTNREIASTEIQIARDSNFSNVAVSAEARGNFYNVTQALPEGEYYWRIRGIDRSGQPTEFSAVQSFEVGATIELSLTSPDNGARIDLLTSQTTGIDFKWTKPDQFGNFEFLVANNPQFNNPTRRNSTAVGQNVSALPVGQYYWKVRMTDPESAIVLSESETRSFTISNEFIQPQPVFPAPGSAVDMTTRVDLPMRWNPVAGNVVYDVRLSPAGGAPIYTERTRGTAALMRDMTRLRTGNFLWAVRACRTVDGEEQCTAYSEQAFTITLDQELRPPEIISPDQQYIVE